MPSSSATVTSLKQRRTTLSRSLMSRSLSSKARLKRFKERLVASALRSQT